MNTELEEELEKYKRALLESCMFLENTQYYNPYVSNESDDPDKIWYEYFIEKAGGGVNER